jgi:carbohydrate-binding DOMON domain-containing protein
MNSRKSLSNYAGKLSYPLPPMVRDSINICKSDLESVASVTTKDSHREVEASYEMCRNPWNGICESSDILVYIYFDDERLPICRSCWSEIADKDFEWSMNKPSHPSRLSME